MRGPVPFDFSFPKSFLEQNFSTSSPYLAEKPQHFVNKFTKRKVKKESNEIGSSLILCPSPFAILCSAINLIVKFLRQEFFWNLPENSLKQFSNTVTSSPFSSYRHWQHVCPSNHHLTRCLSQKNHLWIVHLHTFLHTKRIVCFIINEKFHYQQTTRYSNSFLYRDILIIFSLIRFHFTENKREIKYNSIYVKSNSYFSV